MGDVMTTAPPPKPPKRDRTIDFVLLFVLGLMVACALIWTGWWSLKRSADPFAGVGCPIPSGPSTGDGARLVA
jgi:hypothetical protein